MTTECQKPKETPPKCALCSGEHTAKYKGCRVYKDLQNARGKKMIRNSNLQIDEKPPHLPQIHQICNNKCAKVLHTRRYYEVTT